MAYDKWPKKLENLSEIMGCLEKLKVHLATYQFEQEAQSWWGAVKPQVGELPLTWNELTKLVDAQYYPRDVKRAKEQKFLHLKQGNTSLMEYAAQFNELSLFNPNK